jgi:hypothetical protein
MINNMLNILLGCWHSNYSFPRTTTPGHRRSPAAAVTGTYVVCLDCGKEFPYDWQQMKIVSRARKSAGTMEPAESYVKVA